MESLYLGKDGSTVRARLFTSLAWDEENAFHIGAYAPFRAWLREGILNIGAAPLALARAESAYREPGQLVFGKAYRGCGITERIAIVRPIAGLPVVRAKVVLLGVGCRFLRVNRYSLVDGLAQSKVLRIPPHAFCLQLAGF